ncbi:hypothetical protein Slin15195_G045410 [Septoria linicola]|uniref:BTB domain-containing protein n=1 Tax=Septoria linicola TaxID=215465 RepID=A0A9Q9ASJ0_9PEZI|nr:hypothetical protein Slin14017_G048930 [Septoria linicola]USW51222.1 hypothetical protein Slin15195_G045410 [Septoria linicola]
MIANNNTYLTSAGATSILELSGSNTSGILNSIDTIFAVGPTSTANMQAPSSDSLYSLLTPCDNGLGPHDNHSRVQPHHAERRTNETAFELLRVLRAPETYKFVHVHYSRERTERPLLICRSILMRTSPLFAADLNRHCLLNDPNTLYLDTEFSVFVILVYWMFHQQVPKPQDFDGEYTEVVDEDDRGSYQIMLVKSWAFAEKWSILDLQNAIMENLFSTFSEAAIDADVLSTCLQISRRDSTMRFALIGYMLWSDEVQEQIGLSEAEDVLADLVDISRVDGFEENFLLAAEVFDLKGRELDRLSAMNVDNTQTYVVGVPAGRERPRAERYFVPLG